MLKGQERARQDITEGELQAIAKAMYEERLAELCTDHRVAPGDAESHSTANRVRRPVPAPVCSWSCSRRIERLRRCASGA